MDASAQTVNVGTKPVAVAVNVETNRIYIINQTSNNVTVINGTDNSTQTVAIGTLPVAIAVKPVTNLVYVVNQNSNNVTVINGADNSTQTIAVGANPNAVVVNPITNRIYVSSNPGNITVVNGADNSIVATVSNSSGGFGLVAVNPTTNRIYAADRSGRLVGINGDDNTAQSFNALDSIFYIAINQAANKVYIVDYGLVQFDAATGKCLTVSTGGTPAQAAVNTITNQVFVANQSLNTVNIITPTFPSAVPLTTSAASSGFSDNTTTHGTPTFNFTATSCYAPNAPAPRDIYYQLDTQQRQWLRAASTGGTATTLTATGIAPFLRNGLHTVYFFATDGTDSTSINPSSVKGGELSKSPWSNADKLYRYAGSRTNQ